ncbi:hypothetical protein KOW79_019867 [Hemibagrus wyckioides]|uniref:Uncharacterized protein n=1 Tax=Hemibagrus wyckioides TaxID=337641 RepID=A0A9D3S9G3_9TELE|nr:hypothetical protein KOW79_019867 [Hemibagrus wyckioides]
MLVVFSAGILRRGGERSGSTRLVSLRAMFPHPATWACTKQHNTQSYFHILSSVSDAHFVPRVAESEKGRGRDGKIKEEVKLIGFDMQAVLQKSDVEVQDVTKIDK